MNGDFFFSYATKPINPHRNALPVGAINNGFGAKAGSFYIARKIRGASLPRFKPAKDVLIPLAGNRVYGGH